MALIVICGPPASGKTTYVRERAKPGDIVLDLDAIASALTPGSDGHTHPTPVLRCAQRARSAAIDEALKHTADMDVWIIHALPSDKALARYADHGAHVVTVDPGRTVVEQRIAKQRHRTASAVAARWYATRRDAGRTESVTSRTW